jgi:hypothetical protein
MATDRVVHLVSSDSAFYENRKSASGLANTLRDELTAAKNVYKSIPV